VYVFVQEDAPPSVRTQKDAISVGEDSCIDFRDNIVRESYRLEEFVLHGMHPSLCGREFASTYQRSRHGVILCDLL
jgi:hypothetical protein